MKIAISGKSGCGNTTVSKIVSERLSLEFINYTFRTMAQEKGLTFSELASLAEKSDEIDKELDAKQVEMARVVDCVLGSRLAIWMLKEADLKVYLKASTEVRAERIFEREGGSFSLKLQETIDRDARDTARYKRIYGIDNNDYTSADIVIDTDTVDQFKAADIIVTAVQKIQESIQDKK